MDTTVKDFNDMFVDMVNQISEICPDSLISTGKDEINIIIGKSPEKIIDLFCQYVLPYKKQIDSGNDDFFMQKDFSSDQVGGDSVVKNIFVFKKLWKQINSDNRCVIKQYMKYLCALALKYLDTK